MELEIPTARVFRALLEPGRYKGAWGGRGSGKSHYFAESIIDRCICRPGSRVVCLREIQKDLRESAKLLIADKIERFGVPGFDVQERLIKTPGGGVIIFQGMREHTKESVKSLEGFDVAWVEEAHTLSAGSLQMLRPTIRKPESELWFSWNPRRRSDPVDAFLRGPSVPENAVVVRANWSDNPWFPAELEAERQHDLKHSPSYRHVWEGDYATIVDGAYYATALNQAREEGRITELAYDPVLERRAFWDLGYSDATTIWIAQFKCQRIYAMDYIEGQGQELGYYISELRRRGHADALCFIPHDGAHHHVGKSVEEHLRDASFRVKTVRNQGRGAAMQRVEASRRLFGRIWFNTPACDAGVEALGAYHEKRDEQRQIGLGPEHDWACFTGDTLVYTRDGTRQIMDLKDEEVLTPCGWSRFIQLGVTGRNAPLVEVAFTDGHTVRCTPEHMFLTASGWRSAESLTSNTLIQSCLTLSPNISTADCIGAGRARDTIRAAVNRSIATCGAALSGQFRAAVTSIIGIVSPTITRWTTSNAYRRESILASLGTSTRPIEPLTSQRTQESGRLSGTSPRRGGFGIAATQFARRDGRSGSEATADAITAAPPSMRSSGRTDANRGIARLFARLTAIACGTSAPRPLLRIASVRRLRERADVYCIHVPEVHCFTLANGAVVHNSDAADSFGMMCQLYEEPKGKLKPDDGGPAVFSVGSGEGGAGTGWMAN